jgi:hypothetical protein
MTRYLMILGLALAAVLTWAALSTTPAGAVEEKTGPAYFYAEDIGPEETAKIDGEDIGEPTAIALELGELICSSVEYNGKPAVAGSTTEAPVTLEPKYEKCHSLTALGTKTTTVTTNGCVYEVEPTVTVTESEQEHFLGLTDIVCPAGKAIEVHVYNTTNESDAGASTLCTFDVPAQNNLPGITLTNESSGGDIVADFKLESITVTKTSGFVCGSEKQTAVYEGQATLRATNEASEFVAVVIEAIKRFQFNMDTPTVLAEKGKVEVKTEKQTLKCESVKYEGEPKVRSTSALSLKPIYSECKFGTKKADVDFKGCVYQFTPLDRFHVLTGGVRNTTAKMKILCTGGAGPITIEVTDANEKKICTLTIGTHETTTGAVDMTNGHKLEPPDPKENYVIFKHTIGGIEYEVKDEPNTCGKNEKLKNATLEGEITVHSYDHAKKQNGIRVVGLNEHKP